jgi:hypothetical protein
LIGKTKHETALARNRFHGQELSRFCGGIGIVQFGKNLFHKSEDLRKLKFIWGNQSFLFLVFLDREIATQGQEFFWVKK